MLLKFAHVIYYITTLLVRNPCKLIECEKQTGGYRLSQNTEHGLVLNFQVSTDTRQHHNSTCHTNN